MSFQTRLAVFFTALLAVVELLIFIVVYNTTARNVLKFVEDDMTFSSNVFSRQINERGAHLLGNTQILVSDFGFRSTVASGDAPTIQSALRNLSLRIKSDRATLISLDGKLVADTDDASTGFPVSGVFQLLEKQDEIATLMVVDGKLYQFVFAPVLAPTPIAWVGMGFKAGDEMAGDLKSQSPMGIDISFVFSESGSGWRVASSTFGEKQRGLIPDFLAANYADIMKSGVASFSGEDYIVLARKLPSADARLNITALFQFSREMAMKPYRPLLMWILALSILGLAICLAGSVMLAKSISRPIRILADAAQNIRLGDYTTMVSLPARDEFGLLADSFNKMMAGIHEREEKISYQALHDTHTGLPNRIYCEQSLDAAIAQARDSGDFVAVILISIDRFSDFTYTLGHAIADSLVKLLGEELQKPPPDYHTVGRITSSGFVKVFPGAGLEEARKEAERILKTFDGQFSIGGNNLDVSVHLGIALFPPHGDDSTTLMQRADIAMNAARGSAERIGVYDTKMDDYRLSRLSLMGELRSGLDNNEFQMYYQPKVDLKTGQASHVEALVRWIHPAKGFMPPDDFIPMAERTGNIHKLTLWALRTCFERVSSWRREGISLNVGINLSARDLLNRKLPDIVSALAAEYGVDPAWATLEITESAIMQDPENSLAVLKSLSGRGFSLSVDDFGTGYSSLGYLKKLPIDEMKIDKSFVMELAGNREDEIIVRASIDLGHNLGLKVIAEGVEDEVAMEKLKHYGCDMAQGYHISRPMPEEGLMRWLATSPWNAVKAAG